MRLTRPSVLDVLKGIRLVIHTIVPEKYRFWKSNQSSVCKRPIALEIGPQGKVLALDYDFDSRESRLVELRLHRPVDVNVRREVFKDARDLCFTNGVVFVAERGSSAIRFIELKGEVLFKLLSDSCGILQILVRKSRGCMVMRATLFSPTTKIKRLRPLIP